MSAIAIPLVRPSINTTPIEPGDLLHMEEQGLFELVDGRIVEKKMSYESNKVAGKIVSRLVMFAEAHDAGDVIPEQSFQCFPRKPKQVRRPDVAFVLRARVPNPLPTGHVVTVPDLAIEVVSPNDTVDELDEKLADYASAAIPLVWVVSPTLRHVRVHRPGQPIVQFDEGQVLTGDTLLPGFSVNVSDLFPTPVPAIAE